MSQKLSDHLQLFLSTQCGAWASYKALPTEINIDLAVQKAKSLNWYFPKVSEQNSEQNKGPELLFYSQAAGFGAGYFGILEPLADSRFHLPINQLQGILVPGLGFDLKGNRLGKGQGHYDRALQEFPGIKVGVTFEALILDQLPTEDWDIRMDYLVTEIGIKQMSKRD